MVVLGWFVIIIMAMISILILTGRGGCFIAGYNTSTRKEKEKYNEKLLYNICGGGLLLLTVIAAMGVIYKGIFPVVLRWMMPWGYLGILALMLILSNTVCRRDVVAAFAMKCKHKKQITKKKNRKKPNVNSKANSNVNSNVDSNADLNADLNVDLNIDINIEDTKLGTQMEIDSQSDKNITIKY